MAAVVLLHPLIAAAQDWPVTRRVDPLDDTGVVAVAQPATSVTGRRAGRPVVLTARCDSGAELAELLGPSLDLYIAWGAYMGDGSVRTAIRLPPAPAEEELWRPSADSTAAFAPSAAERLQSLHGASRAGGSFVARATPVRENPITATWDLDGADSALGQVLESVYGSTETPIDPVLIGDFVVRNRQKPSETGWLRQKRLAVRLAV